ncbi:hypothetical protein JQC91_00115 [Jannaschia sp. Os4]|uniref:hypothetical protein n=1 Tax=Jannaschia sp. Os4 TaxID=2807617 RepID=UPI00193A7766|nr:hypothetical protein [Jannaschia sp. Os4]MBM2574693.1 hypothetical protein [Jannaschia sp. Os4]
MFRTLLAAIAFCLVAVPASAVEGRLVGLGGMDVVFVWKDKAAQSEGLDLISANVHRSNPTLLLGLLSCIVPTGTRAVTTDAGFVTHDVLVIEGGDSGCRGNVPVEAFDMR